MTDNHPVTPPPELWQQWYNDSPDDDELGLAEHIATKAANWGADQELLACGNYLERCASWEEEDVTEMYNYRRPRPRSLRELALEVLMKADGADHPVPVLVLPLDEAVVIRRALEALPE